MGSEGPDRRSRVESGRTSGEMVLADAHVHVHACFDVEWLCESAYRNMEAAARECGDDRSFQGVLLLTRTSRDLSCRDLMGRGRSGDSRREGGSWTFEAVTGEDSVVRARTGTGKSLFVVPGRQIVTAEGLELLALAMDGVIDDGLPIREALNRTREADGIPVVPWGVGKWLGRRGRVVENLMGSERPDSLFFGDNGNRPVFWRNPALLGRARDAGYAILPGSDPLPFPSEARRVGSFGFIATGRIDDAKPLQGIKALVRDPGARIRPYGKLQGMLPFLRHQTAIRSRRG